MKPNNNIGNILSSIAPLASLIPGVGTVAAPVLGAAGSLMQQNANRIPSTRLAGGYANGGPINPVISRESTYIKPLPTKVPVTPGVSYGLTYPTVPGDVLRLDLTRPEAKHMTKPGPEQPHMMHTFSKPARYREKAYGGDLPLNSNSFQVNANPNQVDSKYYPGANVALDHNEVVVANPSSAFVFSNRITNPTTGASFAEDARKHEIAVGKAEKKLKTTPNDVISANTARFARAASQALASQQEQVAAAMGKRSNPTHMAYGGPLDPPTKKLGPEWHNGVYQMPIGIYQPTPPTVDDAGSFDPAQALTGADWARKITGVKMPAPSQPDNSVLRTPRTTPYGQGKRTTVVNPKTEQTFPNPSANLKLPPITTGSSSPYISSPTDMDLSGTIPTLPPYYAYQGQGPSNSTSPTIPSVTSSTTAKLPTNTTVTPTAAIPITDVRTRFTLGDYMQLGSAAVNILQGLRKPEVEKPHFDTSRVTRTTYDVQPQLAQSQRDYQNALNNTSTNSASLRRSVANQLYAQKLNSDSRILEQYQGLNNQALQQYEAAASNQARYNSQQMNYTDDLNARNRAAALMGRDAALQSVANVGMMLNQKKQADAYVQALKIRYPDIADSYINQILGNGQ